MEKAASQLEYTPLDKQKHEIRLVDLQPRRSPHDNVIRCGLKTVDLDSKLEFEALSYEWGDLSKEEEPFVIMVDECSVNIRENLWWALYYLTPKDAPRLLWIDAICINQGDVTERNHQVSQMKLVYSEAASVIAWVGQQVSSQILDIPRTKAESEGETHLPLNVNDAAIAIVFMREIAAFSHDKDPYNRSMPIKDVIMGRFEAWNAVRAFCRRSYWTRLWIIQEIVLASSVVLQCGPLSISWDDFAHLFMVTNRSASMHARQELLDSIPCKLNERRRIERIFDARKSRFYPPTNLLLDLLLDFRYSKCHDIRDRIFGVLILCRACCRNAMVVDYTMDITALAKSIIDHYETCHIFPHALQDARLLEDQKMGVLEALGITEMSRLRG